MHTPSERPVRQQTHSNEDSHDESADNTQKEPAKRGYTKMRKIAKMADGKQLDVTVNSYNQFNGQDATTFANYLGTLVRNGEEVPLNYMNWKYVPKDKKNRLWDLVKLKWNVQEQQKDQVMKSFGKKLREFRYSLKKKHYDTHDSYDARIADRDERVLPDHWKFLIDVWDSEDWQDKSKIGKASRAKQTTTHCAGSKSFARIAQEERVRLKRSPTRAEIYITTHCDKSNRPMNGNAAALMRKMADVCEDQPELELRNIKDGDLYSEIFGKEKNGCVRGLGLGPAPTDVVAREAQRKAEEDKPKMEEEREEEREEIRAMRAQMADMKEQIEKLANEKLGHPHVPVTDKGDDNYNQNNIGVDDDASSAASHHTYNMDSIKIRSQKLLSMVRKRESPILKQKVDRQENHGDGYQKNRPPIPRTDKGETRKREAHLGKHDAGKRVKHVVNQGSTRCRLYSITRKSVVAEGCIIMDDPDFTMLGSMVSKTHLGLSAE